MEFPQNKEELYAEFDVIATMTAEQLEQRRSEWSAELQRIDTDAAWAPFDGLAYSDPARIAYGDRVWCAHKARDRYHAALRAIHIDALRAAGKYREEAALALGLGFGDASQW